jgi:hypothetical protein
LVTDPRAFTREGLEAMGFTYIEWDGMFVASSFSTWFCADYLPSQTEYILDAKRRIVACLDGRPAKPPPDFRDTWMEDVIKPAHAKMEQGLASLGWRAYKKHGRGNFPSMSSGLSFGGGRLVSPESLVAVFSDVLSASRTPSKLWNPGYVGRRV